MISYQRIVEHEDRQSLPVREWLRQNAVRNGLVPPPASRIVGTVNAMVNHGRWIVRCPTPWCNNAVVASFREPVFWCFENDAGWFTVIFPATKQAIERTLLMREVRHRNWEVGESVADLRLENLRNNLPEE